MKKKWEYIIIKETNMGGYDQRIFKAFYNMEGRRVHGELYCNNYLYVFFSENVKDGKFRTSDITFKLIDAKLWEETDAITP